MPTSWVVPALDVIKDRHPRLGPCSKAPDLVQRRFTAAGPDRLWVADITYVSTWSGFLYLAIVLDVWSRRIVGWAMATRLFVELVLDALNMVVWVVRLLGPRRVEVYEPDQPVRVRKVGEELTAPGILRNPVPVLALYDRAAAHEVVLRNLPQRRGYEDLDAVRNEAGSKERRSASPKASCRCSRRVAWP